MTFCIRCFLSLLLIACWTITSARSQSPAKVARKGSISGKVVIKGKAAAGVAVSARPSEMIASFGATYKAVTDPQGIYKITDLLPGNYYVNTITPALVPTGNTSEYQSVVLAEGESAEDIDFSLSAGGVITGKITDADGRPVIEQRVFLLPADPQNESRRQASSAQTDDRGIYRIFGLAAGRYKVSVGQSPESNFAGPSFGRPVYKQTFHPDVTDPAKATVIEVTGGSEATNIDITIGRVSQTFTASGRAIDGENGQPLSSARFAVRLVVNAQAGSFIGGAVVSNSKGEFRVENLIPGKYMIAMMSQQNSPFRADAVPFEVVDQDITDLLIKTSKGVTLSGNVVLENIDDKAVLARLTQLRIQAFVQGDGAGGNMGHTGTINGDSSFVLNGLEPGLAYLSLGSMQDRNVLKGFTIVRVERDGVVSPRGIEIKKGEQISGVRVVVSYGNATLRGIVNVLNGSLPPGGRIFVRLNRNGEIVSNIRPPTVDARGHFIAEGLPAGSYEVSAGVFIPGVRTVLPPTKELVNISDGAVTEVTLSLDLTPKPGP